VPPVFSSLSQEIHHLHADLCSALADPTRILLVYALSDRPHHVGELVSELCLPQSTVSRHLRVLRERGLVSVERRGVNVEYSLIDQRLIESLDILREVLRESLARRALLVLEQEAL
jgi:ArsR family transcriptional regulator